jgi:hypothetical protein
VWTGSAGVGAGTGVGFAAGGGVGGSGSEGLLPLTELCQSGLLVGQLSRSTFTTPKGFTPDFS